MAISDRPTYMPQPGENDTQIQEFIFRHCCENNVTPKAAREVATNWRNFLRPIAAKYAIDVTISIIKPLAVAYGKWLDTIEW